MKNKCQTQTATGNNERYDEFSHFHIFTFSHLSYCIEEGKKKLNVIYCYGMELHVIVCIQTHHNRCDSVTHSCIESEMFGASLYINNQWGMYKLCNTKYLSLCFDSCRHKSETKFLTLLMYSKIKMIKRIQ